VRDSSRKRTYEKGYPFDVWRWAGLGPEREERDWATGWVAAVEKKNRRWAREREGAQGGVRGFSVFV
jgi:hypothetical protein